MKKISLLFLILFYASFSAAQSVAKEGNLQQIEATLSKYLYQYNAQELNELLLIYKNSAEHNQRLTDFAAGRIAFLQNDYDNAISFYRKVLAENPSLTSVRFELAITLLHQKQNEAAKQQFERIKSDPELPEDIRLSVERYLENLEKQDSWNIDFSINYVREKNVNNVSSTERIILPSNALLSKSGGMLPQKAQGFAYYLNASRDFNIFNSHYLSIGNQFFGKNYWDNHKYDDISNRIFVGYAYKTANNTFRIKPFYEKRWYGNESYRWNNGVRIEDSYWINPNWQLSLSFEYAKQRYFDDEVLNGHYWQFSSTLVWFVDPKQFLYLGGDFVVEKTKVRQYSYNSKGLRLGWGYEWESGFSSQIGLSFIMKEYKDIAKLGNLDFFSFGKVRKDHIYFINTMIWKRDWHLWGITPKLQLIWNKRDSNIPQMYSYKESNMNVVFEKRF